MISVTVAKELKDVSIGILEFLEVEQMEPQESTHIFLTASYHRSAIRMKIGQGKEMPMKGVSYRTAYTSERGVSQTLNKSAVRLAH